MMSTRTCISLFFSTLLLIGCRAGSHRSSTIWGNSVHKTLSEIESHIYDHPDSALAELKAIPANSVKGKTDKAKMTLLLSMAENRIGIRVTDDSLMTNAINWYERHGTPEDRARAYYCLGSIQKNAEFNDLSIISFTKSESFAKQTGDYFLQGLICQELASFYSSSSTDDEVIELLTKANIFFSKADNKYCYGHSMLDLADALDNQGRTTEADLFYKKADSIGRETGDTTLYCRPRANSALKTYPYAISTQRDYYANLAMNDENEARSRLRLIILVSILSLIAIAALGCCAIRLISKRNKIISRYIGLLQEFKEKDSFRDTENKELRQRIRSLFSSTMGLIDKISYKYSIHSKQPDLESSVFKEIKVILKELKKDDKDGTLETILNNCYDNAISKFRTEFPKLKEEDYRLVKYWMAGFSNDVMALFLDETIDNLYSRKSRIKRRILNTDTASRQLFVSVIIRESPCIGIGQK